MLLGPLIGASGLTLDVASFGTGVLLRRRPVAPR